MRREKHIKRFDGGRRSPQEYHAEFAFPKDAKCGGCSAKPSVRALVMMPLDEAEKHGLIPAGASKAPLLFPQLAPVLVPIRESGATIGFYLRVSMTYACKMCLPAMEKALAKSPSWAIVEINRGPDPTNRVTVGLG